jgi:prophage antirepressor-like protein
MQNNIQVFENQEFGKFEVLMIEDKPYFPATECAKVLGYNQPEHAIKRHCKGCTFHTLPTAGGNQQKKFITEGDLYRLIIRSKLPAAVRFEAWVFDTVLPSIRKYGAYIHDELLKKVREHEEFAEILLERLEQENNMNHSLTAFANQAIPKIRYHDIVLQCPEAVQVSIIAKDYGMSAVSFNKLLYKLGVQFRMGKTWLLYSKHMGNGYTITKTYEINGRLASIHMCWTQRGRYWLYTLLKSHGILPEAEKLAAS